MPTSLQAIATKAKENRQHRFLNLYRLIDEQFLAESWLDIRENAAYGVDRVSAEQYEENLTDNIRNLVEKLKKKSYRARLVRRHWIPKTDGRMRPLGIPVVEDKLLQLAVARILGAIYEQEFLPSSYGYRPKRGALDAVEELTVKLQFEAYDFIVEADIQAFFEQIDHERLIEMLSLRIADKTLLRLIQKWLKAGVLETNGEVTHPISGSPQGGVISPVLANVYLHHVLDVWFQEVVKRHCRGKAFLIRYADDFVCGFEREHDAQRFHTALGPRLGKYGLKLAEAKTRILRFCRKDEPGTARFDFLGFEFFWGDDRQGVRRVQRRTSRKKLRNSLANFTRWCKRNRSTPLRKLFPRLLLKLKGYYNYYGVTGNYDSLREFFNCSMKILRKWVNRRSQRPSYSARGFAALLHHFQVPWPRLCPRRRSRPVICHA
jgi:group II intron reverse transcriptase/maturase